MDKGNLADLRRVVPREHRCKPRLFLDYSVRRAGLEVPDPYYRGPEGFEQVLDMAEDGCAGLLTAIKKKLGGQPSFS
jgi:protein-tyrosine phosphatase